MNRILFEKDEIVDGRATFSDERAEHVLNVLHGAVGQTLKTGGGAHGPDARFYFEDNLLWGGGSGITMMEALTSICRRNTFCGKQSIQKKGCSPTSSSLRMRW